MQIIMEQYYFSSAPSSTLYLIKAKKIILTNYCIYCVSEKFFPFLYSEQLRFENGHTIPETQSGLLYEIESAIISLLSAAFGPLHKKEDDQNRIFKIQFCLG